MGRRNLLMAAGLLLFAGAFVPAEAWVGLFRGSSPGELPPGLAEGIVLFRVGFATLGVTVVVGAIRGWWSGGSAPSVRPVPASSVGLVAVVVAVGMGLRLYALDAGLWLDEILTLVHYVVRPVGEIVTTYDSHNQHFLYSVLGRISTQTFGLHPWALRLPAVVLGVAGLWALYLFGRQVTEEKEALLAAAILAVAPHHVWFSQNARGYTGLLFFTLISSWLLLRAAPWPRGSGAAGSVGGELAGDGDRREDEGEGSNGGSVLWLWYAVSVAAAVYTHKNFVFVMAAHLTLLAWWTFRDAGGREWVEPALLGGVLVAGLLVFQLHALVIPQFLAGEPEPLAVRGDWSSLSWLWQELRGVMLATPARAAAVAGGLTVTGAGLWSYSRDRSPVVVLLLVPTALCGITLLAVRGPLWPRFFFFAAGFALLVLVRGALRVGQVTAGWMGLGRVGRSRMGLAVVTGGFVAAAAGLPGVYGPKQDFRGAREFVESVRAPGDAVVAVGLTILPYRDYLDTGWSTAKTAEELRAIRREHEATWVLRTLPSHLEAYRPEIASLLRREFRQVRAFPGTLKGGAVVVEVNEGAARRDLISRKEPPVTIPKDAKPVNMGKGVSR